MTKTTPSDLSLQTSDFSLQTSDFSLQTSDFIPHPPYFFLFIKENTGKSW